jgi:hypothetical protein
VDELGRSPPHAPTATLRAKPATARTARTRGLTSSS